MKQSKTLPKTDRRPRRRLQQLVGRRRVKLKFMVVPELLATKAYVPNAVRCRVVNPEAIFLTGILGESGRKLVMAGIEFYFTRKLAEQLIEAGIAVKSSNS